MKVHLLDGTYELFRHYYALPKHVTARGEEVAAARGVVVSVLGLLEAGATHVAVATDHVIESFRNELWPGYKNSSGIEPDLLSQFPLVEEALAGLGVTVWPMEEYEADDALASGAARAAASSWVSQVLICTPDKDLAQCVVGERVVQFDRRHRVILDEDAVVRKFGVRPSSIPDFLALVGDAADGFPGIEGWGRKSAAVVLARYGHLEEIPDAPERWGVQVRGAVRLAASLRRGRERAFLFRRLATLVREAPVTQDVNALRWRGPAPAFPEVADRLESLELVGRGERALARR